MSPIDIQKKAIRVLDQILVNFKYPVAADSKDGRHFH